MAVRSGPKERNEAVRLAEAGSSLSVGGGGGCGTARPWVAERAHALRLQPPVLAAALPLGESSLGPAVPADDPCEAACGGADPTGARKYYRARYHDPHLGRFINEDPIRFESGVNFYSYVAGNPVLFTDPLGFVRWSGGAYSGSVVEGVGIMGALFDLTSECKCGVQYTITVLAVGPAFGVGMTFVATRTDTAFEDFDDCPDPAAFNGWFVSGGAGMTAGAVPIRPAPMAGTGLLGIGVSVGAVNLGGAKSVSFRPGASMGTDKSITGSIGSSTVIEVTAKKCCDTQL
jgi:RHS repeat-associated protein